MSDLSLLKRHGLINMEPDEASKQAEAVVEEIRKSGLSQEHFASLLGRDGRSILECVLENEAGLFPFGYR